METANEQKVALTHVICVGGMSWGRAETPNEAFMNWLRNERPRGDMVVHFRNVDKEAFVDGMGSLMFNRKVDLPDVKVKKAVIERYMNALDEIDEMLYPVEDAMLEIDNG